MDYSEKVLKALELASNQDDIDYILDKLMKTEEINRRTPKGRELTEKLRNLCFVKARELIDNGDVPFN